ncbi:MAG: sensor histidine kinase, partial [Devosia sp.]|nr:sensor histidine kinase [Devosia sp.]
MKPPLSLRSGIPLTVRVPLVVVLLMVVISIGVSQLVLWRLVETQERQLGDLANAYLDGLESSLVDPVLRRDSWEVFDILDRARAVYAAVRPIET